MNGRVTLPFCVRCSVHREPGTAINPWGEPTVFTILGGKNQFCDGVSRRHFLQVGGLAMGGISLPQMLRAEAAAGIQSSHKAIIMVLCPGGPPHLDMYDLKPHAPAEIRGEFNPIETSVPGIEICELMPEMAKIMDKLIVVRSLYGGLNDHNVHQCLTGWETHPQQGDSVERAGFPPGGWPTPGAVLSHTFGPVSPSMPPFLSLAPPNAESTTRASLNQSGFLGVGHSGFEPIRKRRFDVVYKSGVSKEQVAAVQEESADIVLKGITLDRLADRRALFANLDRLRREADNNGIMEGMDAISQQAFGILSSGNLANALDFKQEDTATKKRYGISDDAVPVHGGPKLLEHFLVARRLVESGARCVTLTCSQWPLERMSRGGFNWDWHSDNFGNARATLPLLDMGVSALVKDLHDRGMSEDVSVVVWGEFGRTPRINGNAGRDHWPPAAACLMAGGGMRTGQIIGSTNRWGEEPKDRPVHYRDVFSTLYHNVGINARQTTFNDLRGRPQYLVDNRDPIHELVS